jgi:hypothetical protein
MNAFVKNLTVEVEAINVFNYVWAVITLFWSMGKVKKKWEH